MPLSGLLGFLPIQAWDQLSPHCLRHSAITFALDAGGFCESRGVRFPPATHLVYEYFLGRFASFEGKGGGEFYTPRSVVKLLVEMIEPYSGRVYDPCCGSGGMFVQAERFIEAHGGQRNDIAVYGQELNDTTWRLAKMNLAIRGIDADLVN